MSIGQQPPAIGRLLGSEGIVIARAALHYDREDRALAARRGC